MSNLNAGRNVRLFIARCFGNSVQSIAKNKVVSKVSVKFKYYCLTSVLSAYAATKGKKLSGILRFFAFLFDSAMSPLELVYSTWKFVETWYINRWADTAPLKSLPSK